MAARAGDARGYAFMMPGFDKPAVDLSAPSAMARKMLGERFLGALVKRKSKGWGQGIAVYKPEGGGFQIRVHSTKGGGAGTTLHDVDALERGNDPDVDQIIFGALGRPFAADGL